MASKCNSFSATQQTITAKLPTFHQRFPREVWALTINETKITAKNSFNRDNFETTGNHESSNKKKPCFGCFAEL